MPATGWGDMAGTSITVYGSPITFDTDFFGKKRSGAIIPGPFASGDEI